MAAHYFIAFDSEAHKCFEPCIRGGVTHALFLVEVYSVLLSSSLGDVSALSGCSSITNCSTGCTSAATVVCRDVDVFEQNLVSL
jgi:hypothetical protein